MSKSFLHEVSGGRTDLGRGLSTQDPLSKSAGAEQRTTLNTTDAPRPTCAARIVYPNEVSKPCTLPAAPDSLYCAIHAGILNTKRPIDGRYAHLFKTQTLLDCYLRMRNDPEIADLTEELALARTLLAGSVARLPKNVVDLADWKPTEKAEVMSMMDTVFRAAETMARVEKQMQTSISVSQLARVTEQAATLFLREIEVIVASIRDDVNAREIRSKIPEIMHRIGTDLSNAELPFSAARWVKAHGASTVPVSARDASPGTTGGEA